MLEGIDDIPWDRLVACGPAADIPKVLNAIAVQNSGEAIPELWGYVFHQGTVYEATAYVVPFLREFLWSRTFKDKQSILELLSVLAGGGSYQDVHEQGPEVRDTSQLQEELARELLWAKNAHEAVGVGTPLYLTLLRDRQVSVRTTAARILSCFPERRAEILPKLRQSLSRERSRDVQAALLLCLGSLDDSDPVVHGQMEDALRRRASDPRSLAAALSLIRIDKERAAPEAVRAVLNALANPEAFPESYAFEVWELDPDPGVEVLETLLFLGPDRAVSTMTDLLETMDEPLDALVDLLPETAFSLVPGERTKPRVFTGEQRRVLAALLHADNAWDVQGKWNLGTEVSNHLAGVPQTRDALRAYLSESEAQ